MKIRQSRLTRLLVAVTGLPLAFGVMTACQPQASSVKLCRNVAAPAGHQLIYVSPTSACPPNGWRMIPPGAHLLNGAISTTQQGLPCGAQITTSQGVPQISEDNGCADWVVTWFLNGVPKTMTTVRGPLWLALPNRSKVPYGPSWVGVTAALAPSAS